MRDFSELLNTIKFKGTHYIIEKGGKPIASMKPINKEKDFRKLGELKALLKSLPRLGEELDGFAVDIEKVYEDQPIMPLGDLWE